MSEANKDSIGLPYANLEEKFIYDKNNRRQMLAQGKDVKEVYVPRLTAYRILDDIRELPIEDIIKIYLDAKQAYLNGRYKGVSQEAFANQEPVAVKFVNTIKEMYPVIIQKMIEQDAIWVLYDDLTKTPFLIEECALAFTKQEYAEKCLQDFMQKQRTTLYLKEEIRVAKFMRNSFFMLGIPSIMLNQNNNPIRINKNSAVEFLDKLSPDSIVNPAFCLALSKLEQERLWKVNYEGKDKVIYDLETDLINTFCEAQFLVPLAPRSTGELQNGKRTSYLRFPSDYPNQFVVPVFTDWNELNKAYGSDKPDAMIWTVQDMLKISDDILINSKSYNFYITPEFTKTVYEEYQHLKAEK